MVSVFISYKFFSLNHEKLEATFEPVSNLPETLNVEITNKYTVVISELYPTNQAS